MHRSNKFYVNQPGSVPYGTELRYVLGIEQNVIASRDSNRRLNTSGDFGVQLR